MINDAASHEERVLRRVLETRAATVEVRPDALAAIRRRTAGGPVRRWMRAGGSMFVVSGGAALGLAGTVAAVVVAAGSCAPPAPTVPEPAGPSGASTPATGTGPATGPTSAAPGGTSNLAVYYLGIDRSVTGTGGTAARPRLYREFHRLPTGGGTPAERTRAAVVAMLDGRTAADPDYASRWPAGATVRGARVSGATVTVDLAGAAANGVDAETARIAVQQLVWTATAASGQPAVRLLLDGRPVNRLWGRVPTAAAMRRAPMAEVVGAVWLINPQHGETVGRTVEVHVAGIVFEATAHLRVRQGTRTVHEQVLTLSAGGPAQGEIKLSVPLAPGEYVIEAFGRSAIDGGEEHRDDHTITVR